MTSPRLPAVAWELVPYSWETIEWGPLHPSNWEVRMISFSVLPKIVRALER